MTLVDSVVAVAGSHSQIRQKSREQGSDLEQCSPPFMREGETVNLAESNTAADPEAQDNFLKEIIRNMENLRSFCLRENLADLQEKGTWRKGKWRKRPERNL